MLDWFKKNWQIVVIFALAFFLLKDKLFLSGSITKNQRIGVEEDLSFSSASIPIPGRQAPPSDSDERLVIKTSSLSLLVKDVSAVIGQIEAATKNLGGFLIDSHLSQPESAATGSISVRIPQDKVSEAMTAFKDYSVKVVSESVSGHDVTDQYVDLDARLQVLLKTKGKFEQILDQATQVKDLLNVQRELTNLQSQIDSVKGQQKYLEQSAKLSKITVYLSTDELSLPYAPTNAWRPTVIFKTAVRSLISHFRSLGSLVIWSAVYLPLLIPIILIVRFIKKRNSKN